LFFSFFLSFNQHDTIKVLWSYGDKDPIDGIMDIKGHGKNRGVKPMHLVGPLFKKPNHHNDDIKQWDVTVKNVSMLMELIILNVL
jgi:hypothetical protein